MASLEDIGLFSDEMKPYDWYTSGDFTPTIDQYLINLGMAVAKGRKESEQWREKQKLNGN